MTHKINCVMNLFHLESVRLKSGFNSRNIWRHHLNPHILTVCLKKKWKSKTWGGGHLSFSRFSQVQTDTLISKYSPKCNNNNNKNAMSLLASLKRPLSHLQFFNHNSLNSDPDVCSCHLVSLTTIFNCRENILVLGKKQKTSCSYLPNPAAALFFFFLFLWSSETV